MKTWSTGKPNPKGDLYSDETPIPPLTITEQYLAMRSTYKKVPREMVNDVLEALGLRSRRA